MHKPILLIDNYDSFTYNIAHLLRDVASREAVVKRNDAFELDEITKYSHVILSPGPGIPSEAGKMPEVVKKYAGRIPIFGICLGHQCIGEVFGGKLKNLSKVVHGVARETRVVEESVLFRAVPSQFKSGRYHSWIIDREGFPASLKTTAVDDEGEIMAVQHSTLPVYGVQFHPESVLTEHGAQMMKNFLEVSI